MTGFEEALGEFFYALRDNALQLIHESDVNYRVAKSMNDELLVRLNKTIPFEFNCELNGYIDALYALAVYEINCCYLLGICSNSDAHVDSSCECLPKELTEMSKYQELKSNKFGLGQKLQSQIPTECNAMLQKYVGSWDSIIAIEREGCYAIGVKDKELLNAIFNPVKRVGIEYLINFFH